MDKFGKFVATVIYMVLSSMIGGFVLTKLWSWFIITTFPAIPPITIIQGLGLALVIGYVTGRYRMKSYMYKDEIERDKNRERISYGEYLFVSFLKSLMIAVFILTLGWIYTWFM